MDSQGLESPDEEAVITLCGDWDVSSQNPVWETIPSTAALEMGWGLREVARSSAPLWRMEEC